MASIFKADGTIDLIDIRPLQQINASDLNNCFNKIKTALEQLYSINTGLERDANGILQLGFTSVYPTSPTDSTGNAGTSKYAARADHAHPLQQVSSSGNMALNWYLSR